MIKKILKKIVAHDYKFIKANQNPAVITRKMRRIAKRYDKLQPIYHKVCSLFDPVRKFFYLLKKQDGPSTIIGTHPNKNWEKQGLEHEWEWKNTGINRVLNHANFF